MDLLNFNPDHEPGGACPLHMPMSLRSAALLLDFSVWRRTSSIEEARPCPYTHTHPVLLSTLLL
jgi:hypothetical protein